MTEFLTNFEKDAVYDMAALMKISELKGEIKTEAYDNFGNPLPDHYAIYCEQDTYEAKCAIERFFYCTQKNAYRIKESISQKRRSRRTACIQNAIQRM